MTSSPAPDVPVAAENRGETILRIFRRKTSLEQEIDVVIEAEFLDRHGAVDLRPSVYRFDGPTSDQRRLLLTRARAEHSVSLLQPPSAIGGKDVDLARLKTPPLLETPGRTLFEFTKTAHRELAMRDRADLHSMLTEAKSDARNRHCETTRDQMLDYINDRLNAGDEEWKSAMVNAKHAADWNRVAATRRKKNA